MEREYIVPLMPFVFLLWITFNEAAKCWQRHKKSNSVYCNDNLLLSMANAARNWWLSHNAVSINPNAFLFHFRHHVRHPMSCRWWLFVFILFYFLSSSQLRKMQFVGIYRCGSSVIPMISPFQWINNHKFRMIFLHTSIHSHILTPFISFAMLR